MSNERHIVSMVVHCLPMKLDEIVDKVNTFPNAECHFDRNKNKLVLLFEADSESGITSYIDQLNSWNGVLSAQLCYHHCESDDSLQEEIKYETYPA